MAKTTKRPEDMTDAELDALLAQHGAAPKPQAAQKRPEDMTDSELDQLLAQHGGGAAPSQPAEEGFNLKKTLRPYVEDLPTYGATAGGIAGAAGGLGVGSVPGGLIGAGVGGVAGSTAKNLIKQYVYDEPMTTEDVLTSPVKEGLLGAGGEALGMGAGKALDVAGKGLLNVSAATSRTPMKAIETYMERYPQVKKFSQDIGGNIEEGARGLQEKFADAIAGFKKVQNKRIDSALEGSKGTSDLLPVMQSLESTIQKMDPDVDKAAINEIRSLMSEIEDVGNSSGGLGSIPAKRVAAIKNRLQKASAYSDSPLALNDLANSGTKNAAAIANETLADAAPDAYKANQKLRGVHRASARMNKRMVTPGEAQGALIEAGAGNNPKAASDLRRLGEAIDQDLLSDSELLAASKYIDNAGILPNSATGFAAPAILGLGAAANQAMEGDPTHSAELLGLSALASPWALKQALRARLLQRGLLPEISKIPLRYGAQKAERGLLK